MDWAFLSLGFLRTEALPGLDCLWLTSVSSRSAFMSLIISDGLNVKLPSAICLKAKSML